MSRGYSFYGDDRITIWYDEADEVCMGVDEALKAPHYQKVPGIECIDVAQHFNFNLGNIIKYAWRCGEKGDAVGDLKKIIDYANYEIGRVSDETTY